MTAEPLTPAQIAGRMTAALATIRDRWDDMLEPSSQRGSGASSSSEATKVEALVSDRQEILWHVRGWCQVIVEDYGIDDQIPDGLDVPDMARFLIRHVDELAANAGCLDALDELTEDADAVRRYTGDAGRPEMALCPCPLGTCDTGMIRPTRTRDDEGRDEARCDQCGALATVSEWRRLAGCVSLEPLDVDGLIALARTFGLRLTPHGVRCIRTLQPVEEDGPSRFDVADAVRYLTRRVSAA